MIEIPWKDILLLGGFIGFILFWAFLAIVVGDDDEPKAKKVRGYDKYGHPLP